MSSKHGVITVCDTGPVNYLFQLTDVMAGVHSLFGTLIVPEAVHAELMHPSTPIAVQRCLEECDSHLSVRKVVYLIAEAGPHPGEREAISLAEDLSADYLLIDDAEGRQSARRHCAAKVVGTVGVLGQISRLRSNPQLYFDARIAELQRTSFRLSESLTTSVGELREALGVSALRK